MSRKVMITCAVTGGSPVSATYQQKSPFPITPAQIAQDAMQVARAGAAIVHVHARNPVTGLESCDPQLFLEIADRIRNSGVDVILNIACGGGGMFFPDPADESRGGPRHSGRERRRARGSRGQLVSAHG